MRRACAIESNCAGAAYDRSGREVESESVCVLGREAVNASDHLFNAVFIALA